MQVIRYNYPTGRYTMYPKMNRTINCSGDSSNSVCNDLPKMNISQTDTAYTIQFAVPGYKKEQFQVTYQNNELLVKATVNSDKQTSDFTRREFIVTSVKKRFKLNETIVQDLISVTYNNVFFLFQSLKRKSKFRVKLKLKGTD